MAEKRTVAALYVETDGCYFGLPDVDAWDIGRDARRYAGPYPIVAHSPCGPWGRYASSHPILGSNYREAGQDDGCFASMLKNLLAFGGVAEHPAHSKAWDAFGIAKPPHKGGWIQSGPFWTCHVEQGHYGHFSRKPTWLLYYGFGKRPPELIWGRSEQRLPAYAIERYGYEKARRIGVMAAVGGKDKTRIRNATPIPFRDLLLGMARTAIMGTVPMEEQVNADEAPGVANPCAERLDRPGSLPCAPNLTEPLGANQGNSGRTATPPEPGAVRPPFIHDRDGIDLADLAEFEQHTARDDANRLAGAVAVPFHEPMTSAEAHG